MRALESVLAALASAACLLAALTAEEASAALPPDWHRGMTITGYSSGGYASPASEQAMRELTRTQSSHVAFLATWYMPDANSASIVRGLSTPSDASLLHAMARARALGFRVVLKPHVDPPDTGPWRGDIAPQPDAWFANYRAMANHYATLASRGEADILVIGTELTSMSSYSQEWRRVIAEVRARFGGRLTFAANWVDGAERISFWDALDYIGIDAFMPLAEEPNPSVEKLVGAWRSRAYGRRVAAVQRRWKRPVLFTELGYQSRLFTASRPWFSAATWPVAQEPQQRAYEAVYRMWARAPWFKGIYWWDWSAEGFNSRTSDGSYRPAGKLAEGTISAWNGGRADFSKAVPWDAKVRIKVSKRGSRGRRVTGSVRRGRRRCTGRVLIEVERRLPGRRGFRTHRRARSRLSRKGTFAGTVRRLSRGRYRARASLLSGRCGEASSRSVSFRQAGRRR